ncbi:MAG: PD40 domain-containing protein, partial [Candidatus Aminicenantes bacterium]|nr:PD40 domain-containing protein [Candidatus Aminicenantes bacterium]
HDAPAWSPAGGIIAYVSRVDQIFDIYALNLRTEQVVKLTESNARNETPSWSPDGRHLVFSSNITGTIQLYTIDYDGSNLRRLTSKGESKLPDWSR